MEILIAQSASSTVRTKASETVDHCSYFNICGSVVKESKSSPNESVSAVTFLNVMVCHFLILDVKHFIGPLAGQYAVINSLFPSSHKYKNRKKKRQPSVPIIMAI